MSAPMNREQLVSLRRIYLRGGTPYSTFLAMRRAVVPMGFGDGGVMINAGYCWIGIETDGYAHS